MSAAGQQFVGDGYPPKFNEEVGEEGDDNWMSTSDYLSLDLSSQVVYTGGGQSTPFLFGQSRSQQNKKSYE